MSTFLGIVDSQYGPEYFVGRHALSVRKLIVEEEIAKFVAGDYLPDGVAEDIQDAMDDANKSSSDVIQLFVQGSEHRHVTIMEVPSSHVTGRLAHVFTSDVEASEELRGEEASKTAKRHFALDVHKHEFGILVDAQRLGDEHDRRVWIEQQGNDIVLHLHPKAKEAPASEVRLAADGVELRERK